MNKSFLANGLLAFYGFIILTSSCILRWFLRSFLLIHYEYEECERKVTNRGESQPQIIEMFRDFTNKCNHRTIELSCMCVLCIYFILLNRNVNIIHSFIVCRKTNNNDTHKYNRTQNTIRRTLTTSSIQCCWEFLRMQQEDLVITMHSIHNFLIIVTNDKRTNEFLHI